MSKLFSKLISKAVLDKIREMLSME